MLAAGVLVCDCYTYHRQHNYCRH